MAGPSDSRSLRTQLQRLVRRLGVLADDKTPCGKELPVSDAHALHLLREHGPLPQTTLQELLGIDKSNVSRLRSRLEAAGRVEAVPAHANGRPITVLRMTPSGRNLAQQLDRASGARFATLLGLIPAGKRRQVLAALDEVNAALARLEPGEEEPSAILSRARAALQAERRVITDRELQVLRLVAQGLTSAQVGDRLKIGRRTVETHRATLFQKLRFESQTDLIRYAVEHGLVPSRPSRRPRR